MSLNERDGVTGRDGRERDAAAVLDAWARSIGRLAERGRHHASRSRGRRFQVGQRGGGRRSPQRLAVEALGVPWELYRDRRRRGLTHDEAIQGVDRRRRQERSR